MNFEWDDNKRMMNLEKHGLDFFDAHELWDSPMLVADDQRYHYGENRFIALGLLKNHVVVCAYTIRENETIRVISFRKANSREVKHYEKIIKESR
ncbi:MAG: hypothetical protein A3I77_06735 [Gammaproteobacteria bacterium RIFCSPLOWO2_02_FULL_42_14]|nr:MAG: hypothetical protein A3B71_02570 [Gammaproteobacteria bacterium RIFCSPHIGHO2_02_FULL_42_43]OGT28891.1 MAG: hypothetical protein A2624_06945 [Gammaproteobacteria bacterium RIFCSPHIGHO2_01_FULL_42_8]OGT51960.1 MAG: hypothetical protein A3E54_04075 [Gammaproteobacteria bacterium RIFCSPHIGHO2_12_FULL_41_25]OGT61065.1 MAG: hypothetical protein A3I77_06735 [Gammaproteobacteria bacterium RIFCSPLOWO2_02_FULL_42_14]OGT86992.1 MAG: hypothetical protein A3G86_00455 [Gammaproteobacteria bacterium R